MKTLSTFSASILSSLFLFLIFSCADGLENYESDLDLPNYYEIDLPPGVLGAQSIAFDCNAQGPYVGVSDGRILKWEESSWTEFAFTAQNRQRRMCDGSTADDLEPLCGRPMGIKFNPTTCDLYIADAYFGLMVVGRDGGQARQLVDSAEGVPFGFLNALDIDSTTGIIYFTDSSIAFQRRNFSLLVLGGDKTGRLLKYDPHSKNVQVLHRGLQFPSGVALSKDNSFLLVAELNTKKILKFSLRRTTTRMPQVQVIAELSRYPNNIELTSGGEFWVALNTPRRTMGPWYINDPVGIKINEHGNIVRVLYPNAGTTLASVSEIKEHAGKFYIGSLTNPYLGVMKI